MENTNIYVVAEVGFEGLFEAMVAQAEADIAKAEAMKNEIANRDCTVQAEADASEALRLARAEALAQDAKQGLAEWLKVLKVLDIADAVIG